MDAAMIWFSKCRIRPGVTDNSLLPMVILLMTVIILELGTIAEAAAYKTYYMEDYCGKASGKTVELSASGLTSAMVVRASRERSLVKNFPKDCELQVLAPENYELVISMRFVNFVRSEKTKKCKDYLQLQLSPEVAPKKYCMISQDKHQRKSLSTMGQNYVNLTMHAKCSERKKGFEIIITGTNTENCPGSEFFRCGNSRCISNELVCDKRNNCGDLSDESGTLSRCAQRISPLEIVVVLVVGILIVGVIFLVAVYVKRRRLSPSNYGRSQSTAYQLSETSPYAPTTTPAGKEMNA